MNRVAIVGSCVTRDSFALHPDEGFEVVYYCQHTCVPSIMSKPVPLPKDIDEYQISHFFKRNLRRDLAKTLFDELIEIDYDILIVDLIEERYNLFMCENSWISESLVLENTPLYRYYQENLRKYLRLSLDPEIFDEHFVDFAQKLASLSKDRVLVVNQVEFAKYYEFGGRLREFDPQYVEGHNAQIRRHYARLREGMPAAAIIDATRFGFRGDPNHRWQCYPFHFETAYYRNFMDNLHTIAKGSKHQWVMSPEERWAPRHSEALSVAWHTARDFFLQGRYHECIQFIELQADGRRLTADELHYYGRSLLELNQNLPEAERVLLAASQNGCEEAAWVNVFLALAQAKLGKRERAVANLRTALDLAHPQDKNAVGSIFLFAVSLVNDVAESYVDHSTTPNPEALMLSNLLRDIWNKAAPDL